MKHEELDSIAVKITPLGPDLVSGPTAKWTLKRHSKFEVNMRGQPCSIHHLNGINLDGKESVGQTRGYTCNPVHFIENMHALTRHTKFTLNMRGNPVQFITNMHALQRH